MVDSYEVEEMHMILLSALILTLVLLCIVGGLSFNMYLYKRGGFYLAYVWHGCV